MWKGLERFEPQGTWKASAVGQRTFSRKTLFNLFKPQKLSICSPKVFSIRNVRKQRTNPHKSRKTVPGKYTYILAGVNARSKPPNSMPIYFFPSFPAERQPALIHHPWKSPFINFHSPTMQDPASISSYQASNLTPNLPCVNYFVHCLSALR